MIRVSYVLYSISSVIHHTGFGWLIVSPAWLEAVGLSLTDISTFSYQRADGVLALEEDCDAPAFIQAFQARFGPLYDLREFHQDVDSEIRNWPHVCHEAGASSGADPV